MAKSKNPGKEALTIVFYTAILFYVAKAFFDSNPELGGIIWSLFGAWVAGAGYYLKRQIW